MYTIVSYAILFAIVGGLYWIYGPKNQQRTISQRPKRATPTGTEQSRTQSGKGASNVLVSGGSGTEATSAAAEKKKKKKKKAVPSKSSVKEVVPTEEAVKAESSDDDVAQEVDQKEVAKRLQAMKESNTTSSTPKAPALRTSRQSTIQKANLAAPPPHSYAASQTSSTGADGDIDEEESAARAGATSTSTDPSDMLEESSGARVLSVKPSAQPPRQPKQKATPSTPQLGTQASKNAKKKEKKKLEKEAERAEQKARFEEHRASMRAAEAAKQKSKPQASAPAPASVWANPTEQGSSSVATLAPAASASEDLLDTFNQADNSASPETPPTDSEEDKRQMRSTHLDASVWEEIPPHLAGGWNEVSSKKNRKQKKQPEEQVSKSSDEAPTPAPAPVPSPKPKETVTPKKAPKQAPKPAAPKETSKGGNGFQALDTFDTVSESKGSSSDWAEVDEPDHWAVHPE